MGTQRVTRTVGSAAAKELILLGERFSALEAKTYGLLHKVVPPDELDKTVAMLADKLSQLPPRTVGLAKNIVDVGYHLPLRDSQDLELDAMAELLSSHDLREGLDSYLEKRRPRFTGE
jgi:enoyl-CoA hydratase